MVSPPTKAHARKSSRQPEIPDAKEDCLNQAQVAESVQQKPGDANADGNLGDGAQPPPLPKGESKDKVPRQGASPQGRSGIKTEDLKAFRSKPDPFAKPFAGGGRAAPALA